MEVMTLDEGGKAKERNTHHSLYFGLVPRQRRGRTLHARMVQINCAKYEDARIANQRKAPRPTAPAAYQIGLTCGAMISRSIRAAAQDDGYRVDDASLEWLQGHSVAMFT